MEGPRSHRGVFEPQWLPHRNADFGEAVCLSFLLCVMGIGPSASGYKRERCSKSLAPCLVLVQLWFYGDALVL